MKKKIKDLTLQERLKICDKHVYDKLGCHNCPFHIGSDTCVHHILNVLEREIEVDE